MGVFRFTSTKLSLLLILGVLLAYTFRVSLTVLICVLIGVLALLGLITFVFKKSTSSLFTPLFGITTVVLGMVSFTLSQPKIKPNYYGKHITTTPSTYHFKIKETLPPTAFGNRYIAKVLSVNQYATSGAILVYTPTDSANTTLKVDQEFIFYGNSSPINGPKNPYQFDYKKYMDHQGIHYQVSTSEEQIILLEQGSTTMYGWAASLRERITESLQKHGFQGQELAIIKALLLGEKQDINSDTLEAYQKAGAVHILALSGLHIGILLFLLQWVLQPLRYLPKGKSILLAVSLIILWCFAFIAGFSPSIVRAVTMFSFVSYALFLNRPSSNLNIIMLSVFFILVVQPQFLFQVGFQMSYAAVFAIIGFYPFLRDLFSFKHIVPRKIWDLFAVSMAAQLGVLPISLLYFHQFPGLFLLSNLILVPFLGIIIGLGIMVILLSTVNALPQILVDTYNGIISLMNSIVSWIGAQEHFLFTDISFDSLQLVLAYLILLSMLYCIYEYTAKNLQLMLLSVMAFLTYQIYLHYDTLHSHEQMVLHQTKNSIIVNKEGNYLEIFTRDTAAAKRTIRDYVLTKRIDSVTYKPLLNAYTANEQQLLVIDSTGVYPTEGKADIILLTGSPKINIDRLLDTLEPKIMVADGSNYYSILQLWKQSCLKRKLPFHYTGEKGAYMFK